MKFSAIIKVVNANPYVDVPKKASAAFGAKGYVKVLARLRGMTHRRYKKLPAMSAASLKRGGYVADDGSFRANLVPTGKGGHILYLNAWMRNAAKADVGDLVEVALKADAATRRLTMPPLFRDALKRDAKASAAWKDRPESARRETIRYLLFLKSREALERNVKKAVDALNGRSVALFVRPSGRAPSRKRRT